MNKKRMFTPEEATEFVPFLETELLFLRQQKKSISEKFYRLQIIKSHVDHTGGSDYAEQEIFELECQLEFLHLEYELHMNSIELRGIQIKDIQLGLADFPALVDDVEVLLCWKTGEKIVSHYHGVEEGYLGRRKLC
ncbi:DUF2203 domain-containing protein [Brevibacillus daliensis]|uniref:DUF2203 domain-containing protein n=1 Tax=Brevibacillus daliensis TaxID=2892995 RepID=UPI001E40B9BC|nr:DUF2203 domain-containing protein [Brevibacillus daliensis]